MSDGRPRAPKPLRRNPRPRSCHADAGARPRATAASGRPRSASTAGVKEGDVVKFDELDERPVMTTAPHVNYPPMAMRQRLEASSSSLHSFSENGDVIDVNIPAR